MATLPLLAVGCGGPARRVGASTPPRSSPAGSSTSTSTSTSPSSAPAPAVTDPSAATVAPLHWSACGGGAGPSGFQCATLRVPLDPADPGKGTIGLALDRHPATGKSLGSLLVDPGGPGVSGVTWLGQAWSTFPAALRQRYAIVGFDPPGVGRSDPVTCGTPAQLEAYFTSDLLPATPAQWSALARQDRSFAAGCRARSGKILPYVGTVDAARDMDLLRAALGEKRLDYLGFSYGTLLGAVYAGMYPHRIRVMALDGAINPDVGALPFLAQQTSALERDFDAFVARCASGRCGWQAGGSARAVTATYERLLQRMHDHPLAVPGTGQAIDRTVLMYATIYLLYFPSTDWTYLGQALTALQRGDGRPVLGYFDTYLERRSNGTFSNTFEAETAVDCADQPAPPLRAIEAAAPAIEKSAPVFGLADLESEVQCATWPVPPTGRVAPVRAAGSPPILVVGTTHDPITPYEWARALASQLSAGVLLTRDGTGHTAYFSSTCIERAVDDYLISTRPPAPGTVCSS